MSIYRRTKINYRKIYEEHYGPIPKGYHIHHIDGNHENNDISNLAAMPVKEHYDTHYEQGDYGACWAMYRCGHLSLSPDERSELSRKNALKMVEDGTNPFLDGEASSKRAKERVKNGTHNLLKKNDGSEKARKRALDRVEAGTHNFLDGEISKRSNRKRIEDRTHHFLKENGGGEKAKKNALERVKNGTHNFLGPELQLIRLNNGTHNFQTQPSPNRIIVTCPHCNKSGSKPAMVRWHFDNCKQKKDIL